MKITFVLKKVILAIVFTVVFVILAMHLIQWGFTLYYFENHIDIDIKERYSCNKVMLMAGLLEDELQKKGKYPMSLREIEKRYLVYLNEHTEIQQDYLKEVWWGKPKNLPFNKTGFDVEIRYLVNENKTKYYLFAARSKHQDKDFKNLRYESVVKQQFFETYDRSVLALASDGKLQHLASVDKIKCEQVSLENVKCNMRKIKKRWLPFIFD